MSCANCPDEETLAAYFDGLLTPNQAEDVHRRLLGCDECQSLFASLGAVIAAGDELPVPFSVPASVTAKAESLWPNSLDKRVSRGVRLAVRWVEGALQPLSDALQPLTYSTMPMRGAAASKQAEVLTFEVDLSQLGLHVTLEYDSPDEVTMTIKLISQGHGSLSLRLVKDGEVRAMSSLDALGATMAALSAGIYHIDITEDNADTSSFTVELCSQSAS